MIYHFNIKIMPLLFPIGTTYWYDNFCAITDIDFIKIIFLIFHRYDCLLPLFCLLNFKRFVDTLLYNRNIEVNMYLSYV